MNEELILIVQAFLVCYVPLSYVFVLGIIAIEGEFDFGKALMLLFSPLSAPFLIGCSVNMR